jgi:hypothetical protein
LLYAPLGHKYIPSNILNETMQDVLPINFKFGNMSLGLLNNKNNKLLDLYTDDGEKLINEMIHHNFIALLDTLSIINGKLYINWINITPILEYKESRIYKNTVIEKKDDLNYNGLYIGEFYNVYRNIYYEDIKKTKWFIYVTKIDNKKQYLIQYLNKYLKLEDILNNTSYEDLDYNQSILFEKNINNINFNNEQELLIWKNFIIYMVNNYTNRTLINYDIKKFFILNNIDELEQENNYIIEKENIINFIKNIPIDFFWEFIKESLIIFQNTIYGKYLIKKIDNKKYIDNNFFEYRENINLKNIYNIAKLLSHKRISDKNKDFILLPTKYSALPIEEQNDFWIKFNKEFSEWVRLKSNLNRENNIILSIDEYNQEINKIKEPWDKIKEELIWEYLVKFGILSEFNIDYKTTDNIYNDKFKKENLKTKFKENKKIWEECNYYLTNDIYKNMDKLRKDKSKDYKELSYFDALTDEYKWYYFYAMDWITQINFFHHYLNHRVLFITGATGQGKSTQVPKLMMYSLKMLDYNNNGKVICTQPRIGPTFNNATRISDELGVMINQVSKTQDEKINTENYYVQYKHSQSKHLRKYNPHLILNMVTDGTLLEQVVNNPFMKNEIPSFKKEDKIYSIENTYDIIMVDEAHEHNTNMDIILTLMRNSCYYNNSIKLIIISATMNDDEPIYRRYYRYINDNLTYPIIGHKIIHPFLKEEFYIDKIYLDRRFHISPPGESTQYFINEIYLPKPIINPLYNNKQNSDITQLKSYDVIKNICDNSITGDILLFANGMNEINKAVKYLNETLPLGNIVLPYYGTLNVRYRDIIEKIDIKINSIKTKREDVANNWGDEWIEDNSVPDGIYKRAIIVATNVAEASITINSLKYVVDNGYAKVNKYDSELGITKLGEELISEASRRQRKGRVGRVGDGTVYYIYEKNARSKILPNYKITEENFCNMFIKLFNDGDDLILEGFDPNIHNKFKNIIIDKKIDDIDETIKNSLFYKSNLYNIITKQYIIVNDVYWNEKYYNYMLNDKLYFFNRKINGYDINVINDQNCLFYLIHPFQNLIERNILYENINKKLKDSHYYNLYNYLYQKDYLKNDNKLFNKNFIINDYKWTKSIMIDYYYKLMTDLKIEKIEDVITLCYSKIYNSFDEILEIYSMLQVIDGTININNGKLFIKSPIIINNYKNNNYQENEIILIYNIIRQFKICFDLPIFKINNIKYIKNNSLDVINNFKIEREKTLLDPHKTFNVIQWNSINNLYNNGLLNEKNINKILDVNINDYFYNDIKNNEKEINKWCLNNDINSNTFIKFLEKYTENKINVLNIKKNYDKKVNDIDTLTYMDTLKKFKTDYIEEKIIRPFIHGYPNNVLIKLSNNIYHTSIINNLNYINSNTFINQENLIFYYTNSMELQDNFIDKNNLNGININNISITNKIKKEWMQKKLQF